MTSLPQEPRLLAAMEATWAPAETVALGPWILRKGLGGGKRVSATTQTGEFSAKDIARAETAMAEMGQSHIFMLRSGDTMLDKALAARGYQMVDPVLIYAAPVARIAEIAPSPLEAIPCDEPLALMTELWEKGGIFAPRLAVIERTNGPKTTILGRHIDRPAGVAFVAVDREIAMLHALEVTPEFRRAGVARNILGRAAIWAQDHGVTIFSLVTTGENLPAQRLFSGLGMQVMGHYHYRIK